ncbi:MAG: hypothetical protein ACFFC7_22615 [Candidatus Hermodarchaeota archaeon]
MTSQHKTVSFIRKQGNRLDLLRLRRTLGEPYTLTEAEEELARYQFPDGSWDYKSPEEDPNRIGSLGGTIHCLRWIRELGLKTSPPLIHTLEFLSSIQASDGSFYETEAKLAHSPQRWLQEETLIDRFYFTAAVPMRLFSLGYPKHPIIKPALKWLTHHWTDWDLVAGTWYGPWALLGISSSFNELSRSLYQRCYDYTLTWVPRLETQPLTWLLDVLQGAGFSAKDPVVTKGLTRLHALQNKDGTWQDPKYSTVESTITALRLLREYGSFQLEER